MISELKEWWGGGEPVEKETGSTERCWHFAYLFHHLFFFFSERNQKRRTHLLRRKSLWYPLHFSLSENKKMVECRRNFWKMMIPTVWHTGGKKKNKKELKKKNKKGVFIRRHSTAVITQTDKKAKLLMPEGPKKGNFKRTPKNIKQILSTEISQNE